MDLYLRTYAAATRGAFPSRDLVALQQLLDRAREARERLRGLLLLPLPQDAPQQRSACASCKTHGSTRDPNVSSEESDAPAAAAGSANGAAARDFPSAEVGAEEAQRCTAQTVAQAEAEAVAAYRAFLAAAGDLARRKFTRFGLPAIGAGCCLVLGCLAVHLVVLGRWGQCGNRIRVSGNYSGKGMSRSTCALAGVYGHDRDAAGGKVGKDR